MSAGAAAGERWFGATRRAKSGGLPRTAGGHSPWAVALVVALATFMEVLDTTIANVALRYISGGLAVGPDEAAWVVTSYLVANAITLTASSFLAKRYGRKAFFMACVALFTVASVACGFAWGLDSLLLFRVLQGLGGGGMAPLAQSILADSFPPEKRGQAFALYGVAIVVAPVVGPTLGGWLSDNVSWHWCFLINGPVGVHRAGADVLAASRTPEAEKERKALGARGIRFDIVGFLLVATFLGSLEVVPRRGPAEGLVRLAADPRSSVISAPSSLFVAMIPWLLNAKNPAVDLRLLGKPPVRLLLPGDAGHRRDPDRDDAVHPADHAGILRLHRHAVRPRPGAGRHRHVADDVRDRTASRATSSRNG